MGSLKWWLEERSGGQLVHLPVWSRTVSSRADLTFPSQVLKPPRMEMPALWITCCRAAVQHALASCCLQWCCLLNLYHDHILFLSRQPRSSSLPNIHVVRIAQNHGVKKA